MAGLAAALLPLAVAVAVNPIPIIAVILILQSPRARASGSAFVGAWVLALLALGGVAIGVANHTDLYGSGTASPVARLIRGVVGALLLYWAARKWLGRPRDGEPVSTPAWMGRLATATPRGSLALGAGLAAGNPKNIALTLAAAAAIVEEGLPLTTEGIALLVFVAFATLGVAIPYLVLLVMGRRADQVLASWGKWLTQHNAAVLAIVLTVIGVLLIVGSITG